MFQSARFTTLALAAILMTGCAGKLPTIAVPKQTRPAVTANATGSVQLKLAGLASAAYRTLATTDEIQTVRIELRAGASVQTRKYARADLMQPFVNVSFDKVPAGKVMLEVQAFDFNGNQIGDGADVSAVTAGSTLVMAVHVKLAPSQVDGSVNAVISFEDGDDPDPVYEDETGFKIADANRDGLLSLEEFSRYYPYQAHVAPLPLDIIYGEPGVSGGGSMGGSTGGEADPAVVTVDATITNTSSKAGETRRRCAIAIPVIDPTPAPFHPCLPPVGLDGYVPPCALPPVYNVAAPDFNSRDLNKDGALTLDEFLRSTYEPLEPMVQMQALPASR